MYYSNFISSPKGYFHTVVCIPEEFKNSNMNHDLHYCCYSVTCTASDETEEGNLVMHIYDFCYFT
jgi:hypothetical protein